METWSSMRFSKYPLLMKILKRIRKESTTWTSGKSCIMWNFWTCCQPSQMRMMSYIRYCLVFSLHIIWGENQTVLQVLLWSVMGGAWGRRNDVQHPRNGVIPLHLTSHMKENTDIHKHQIRDCLCLTTFFIPREQPWGKPPGSDLCQSTNNSKSPCK